MAEQNLILDFPVQMQENAPDGFLHGHVWFNYLQHIAAIHAEQLGFGMTAIQRNGLIWVLSRIQLHLDSYPYYDDVVRVETYPNGVDRIFAKRQFVLSSAKTGRRFGYASSFWLVLELPSFRPRPPASALEFDVTANLDREDFFPVPVKIAPAECSDPMVLNISGSHIDLNDHLNNSYYCEYALDWVAGKRGCPVRFSDIRINYNRAMRFGEQLVVSGRLDGHAFHVEGVEKESGKNSFFAEGTYQEIQK